MNGHEDNPNSFGLKHEELLRLRGIVLGMAGANNCLPHELSVALAREPGLEAGITIDFQASLTLGSPLVILRPVTHTHVTGPLSVLSPRELSVAGLIASGLSNKEIARRLAIALSTVKDHVHNILEKTEMTNRAAVAAAYSISLDYHDEEA